MKDFLYVVGLLLTIIGVLIGAAQLSDIDWGDIGGYDKLKSISAGIHAALIVSSMIFVSLLGLFLMAFGKIIELLEDLHSLKKDEVDQQVETAVSQTTES